jgi:hypothetical protein
MINKEARTDLRSGMDLDSSERMSDFTDDPGH